MLEPRGGTRERLPSIVAGAAVLFSERGYEATSINELADQLGISVGGLYRYIRTKSDLLEMVCESIYGDLPDLLNAMARSPRPALARLGDVLAAYFRSCAENRDLITLMYREYRHLPIAAQERFMTRERSVAATFEGVIASGMAAGELREVDGWLVARDAVLLGHLPALKSWELRHAARPTDQVVAAQVDLVLDLVRPEKRRRR